MGHGYYGGIKGALRALLRRGKFVNYENENILTMENDPIYLKKHSLGITHTKLIICLLSVLLLLL